MTKAAEKLTRIEGEILKSNASLDSLSGEIAEVDDLLTAELGKLTPDESKVTEFERRREALAKDQARLAARVEALQSTVADNQKAADKASLKAAINEQKKTTEELNVAVAAYRTDSIKLAHDLGDKGQALREQMEAVSGVRDKVRYFAAVLGKEAPQFPSPDSLTTEDLRPLLLDVRRMTDFRLDPWNVSEYGGKLNELARARKDAKIAGAEQ